MVVRFEGLEVKPVSHLTTCAPMPIDRVYVKAFRTLMGKEQFQVFGQMGDAAHAEPVSEAFQTFGEAWAEKVIFDGKINAARIAAGGKKNGNRENEGENAGGR